MALAINDLDIPYEFSGPAQLLLFTRYGDPRDPAFEQKWITSWDVHPSFPWFPEKRIYLHKHFIPMIEAAFKDLGITNRFQEIRTFDGAFEVRNVRGSDSVLSTHSWGAAIDLNASENPVASAGQWSPEFIKLMVHNHIFCGQNWTGRKDPMHFAMVDG